MRGILYAFADRRVQFTTVIEMGFATYEQLAVMWRAELLVYADYPPATWMNVYFEHRHLSLQLRPRVNNPVEIIFYEETIGFLCVVATSSS